MKTFKIIFIISILTLIYSCQNKIQNPKTYSLGLFYSNNKNSKKDKFNHFNMNCVNLLKLKGNIIEIYDPELNKNSMNDFSVKFKLKESDVKKMIEIIKNEVSRKKIKYDQELAYCGPTYVSCIDNQNQSKFSITGYGLKKAEDFEYILNLVNKVKDKKIIPTSNKLKMIKYFMNGYIYQNSKKYKVGRKIKFLEPINVE